jgi:hypothetical protein
VHLKLPTGIDELSKVSVQVLVLSQGLLRHSSTTKQGKSRVELWNPKETEGRRKGRDARKNLEKKRKREYRISTDKNNIPQF